MLVTQRDRACFSSCCCKHDRGMRLGDFSRETKLTLIHCSAAKNQGLTITKNSASTTLHNNQVYGSSHQGASNARINVETTTINGFQSSKNELDIAMLQILDPHLRPVPPEPSDATSKKIYKEHMDLAQEYFKVGKVTKSRCFSSKKRLG